ncbi:MAG: hypothetical protein ACOH5I_02930 [Oligoflexus sp.]
MKLRKKFCKLTLHFPEIYHLIGLVSLGMTDVRPALKSIEQMATLILERGATAIVIGNMPALTGLPELHDGSRPLSEENFAKVTTLHNEGLTRHFSGMETSIGRLIRACRGLVSSRSSRS